LQPLERDFYRRDTLIVARELLGKRLVRGLDGTRLSGFITEVEAYIGQEDSACHASRGRTPRNAVMYGPPSRAYIYLIYGLHHCLNVVTGTEGFPAAVLIRALEPEEGLELMRQHRPGRSDGELSDGPGKLCQALRIDRALNGADLSVVGPLYIAAGKPVGEEQVVRAPRIGIDYAAEKDRNAPWRLYVK
jgi:DNA-3-methyladenine glycosylase